MGTTPKELALHLRKMEDVTSTHRSTLMHSEDLLLRFSGETLLQVKESLAKKCFEMIAGTAEEDGYRKFCEQFEHFQKFGIIEDSTD